MNLYSVKTIKELLTKHGIDSPKKQLGQNFLVDATVIPQIIRAANIQNTDTIIEVGPGIGTLTQELAAHAKRVIAVEKDAHLIPVLEESLQGQSNIEIVCGDILKTRLEIPATYKVVANLPYYITAPTIRKFLEIIPQPELLLFMVQKEVAQRICASPPNMTLLSTAVQFYAKPELIRTVKKSSFWPSPKVDSALLLLTPHTLYASKITPQEFFSVMRAGFLHPRRQILNNLAAGLSLEKEQAKTLLQKSGVSEIRRAETLSLEEWLTLANTSRNIR